VRWLIAGVLALSSCSALADGAVYGEVNLGAGGVRHSDLDFYPGFASLTLGAYVLPNIGIEVFADAGVRDHETDDFTLEVENAYGIATRFQSPSSRGVQGFIVLGYVNYQVEQASATDSVLAGSSVDEMFRGARVSVGLMQRLVKFPNVQLTGEYRHYNADQPIRLDALLLGVRFNTP